MSLRGKFLTILGVVVLFIVIVILFVFAVGGEPKSSTGEGGDAPTQGEMVNAPVAAPEVEDAFRVIDPPQAPADVNAVSRSFAERYGSFSNQGNFTNLEELYPAMTSSFRQENERVVSEGRARANPNDAYVGVTTRALRVVVGSQTEDRAIVDVSTQRRTVRGSANPEVTYQTLELALAQEGGEWKIDGVLWK